MILDRGLGRSGIPPSLRRRRGFSSRSRRKVESLLAPRNPSSLPTSLWIQTATIVHLGLPYYDELLLCAVLARHLMGTEMPNSRRLRRARRVIAEVLVKTSENQGNDRIFRPFIALISSYTHNYHQFFVLCVIFITITKHTSLVTVVGTNK
jgi:hypothetical protein